MPDFAYTSPIPLGPDDTKYRHLTAEHVSIAPLRGAARSSRSRRRR